MTVAAVSCKADEGDVVLLAFGPFAVVEGLGLGRAQRRERGEERGVLEPVVAASALGLAVEGLAGLAGDRGEAGVGGELGSIGEAAAVADLGEDPGAGAWPDAGQAEEQFTERVSEEDLLDLGGEGVAGPVHAVQLAGTSCWAAAGFPDASTVPAATAPPVYMKRRRDNLPVSAIVRSES